MSLDTIGPILIKGLILVFIIIAPIFVISAIYKKMLEQRKMEWFSKMRFIVLRILVPKNNEKTPLAAEQMFAALHGIFRGEATYQDYISFEIAARDKYIQFYVCLPTHLKDFVQGQIYSQYPTAEIHEVDDYTQDEMNRIQNGELRIAGADLELINNDVFPIKSFVNFEVDPLAGITGVLSKVEKDEQIWMQLIVKPVPDDWQKKSIAFIKKIKSGGGNSKGFFQEIGEMFIHLISGMIVTFISGTTPPSQRVVKAEETKLSGTEEAGLKGVEAKATKLGFETKIRLLSLAPNENAARARISSVVGAFKQFNIINLNGFQAGSLKTSEDYWQSYHQRQFFEQGYVLNIEELASIYHLPSVSVATPNLVWSGSKKGEPPANLPIEENVYDEGITLFAKTDFRHMQHKFGIKIADRRYHMYAIGKTGTGKSTMLENMAIDDIREGRGLAVVDPHGDLINHILEYIPEDRIKDVVLFQPSDRMYPVAFNPLENVDPDLKSIVASGVVGIFKKLFAESWGPRLEYILRNTVIALLDYPNATMLGITRILVDKQFRDRVISQVQDPVIKDFFINEFEQYDPKFRTEAIAPIQNKVGQFLSSSTIRNIVGQPKSTIDIKEIMDSGKIFLVNLSIGEIGEDASSLLGSLMITKIQLAAMQRASMSEEDRRDFYLYVDEFQNFATDSFAVILSEARKYKLNLIMTNQYVAQMPEAVRDAVFGNVGSLVSFRIGAPDADLLQKEFEPVFEANDLVNLDNYHVYVKMSIDGVTSPAFSAVTLPRSAQKYDNRDKILTHSRQVYSRNREFVERQIEEITELPKVDEIMTKAERRLVPKAPPKIGDTYYREVQTAGDVRWYLGGGTADQPLNDEVVQEKLKKISEKAEDFKERRANEMRDQQLISEGKLPSEESNQNWPTPNQVIIEEVIKPQETVNLSQEKETEIKEEPILEVPEPPQLPREQIPIIQKADEEIHRDKELLSESLLKDTKPLEEGQVINLHDNYVNTKKN